MSPRFLYLFEGLGYHKIGITSNIDQRVEDLRLPVRVNVVHVVELAGARDAERTLHRCFAHKRVRGEWFQLDAVDVMLICSLKTAEDFRLLDIWGYCPAIIKPTRSGQWVLTEGW